MNKAVLLQLQQEKAKASKESKKSQAYDNMSYEKNEINQYQDLNFTKLPSRPSGMEENQQKEKITDFWASTIRTVYKSSAA